MKEISTQAFSIQGNPFCGKKLCKALNQPEMIETLLKVCNTYAMIKQLKRQPNGGKGRTFFSAQLKEKDVIELPMSWIVLDSLSATR
ncbi:MAG TPA: hypothetical protein PKD52_04400 [Clostridiales bacterium]|nr:hypothetical protein [Clostridiales bacterium]